MHIQFPSPSVKLAAPAEARSKPPLYDSPQPLPTRPPSPHIQHPRPPPSGHLCPANASHHHPAPSSHRPSSSADPRSHLPQDILHILESNFTGDSADNQDRKDQQISRVAEELRVKARLSRYRRVRDQLSDSEDEDSEPGKANRSSEEDTDDESEENRDKKNDCQKFDPQSDNEADLIDGSGDEDEEQAKNNKALAKLKTEIEQIIGIPQNASYTGPLEAEKMMTDHDRADEKPTIAKEPELQTADETAPKISQDPLPTTIVEQQDLTAPKTIEEDESVKKLLAQVKSQIDQLNQSSEHAPIRTTVPPAPTCPKGEPLPSTVAAAQVEPAQPRSNPLGKPQVAKPKKKPPPKKRVAGPGKSGDESEDEGGETNASMAGPTTANELKEPPPDVVEVPFTRVSDDDELRSISPFGSVTSQIGNVLVIQGTAGLGYDRVLDEGTLVCQKNGLVVGKIFETFGSVTSPHYSIRLPNHILACAPRNDEEGVDLSPGVELCYLPRHSHFVFTAELKAQPKGTDASKFYDEEVGNPDEIEFSDDEAEAEYRKACKLARKTAKDPGGNGNHQNNPRANHSVHVSEHGRRMIVHMPADKLNYGADDVAHDGTVESDYSLLERPKDFTTSHDTSMSVPTPTNPTNRQASGQRARGKKRATGARDRNRKNLASQPSHPSSGQPANTASGNGPSRPAGTPRTGTQSGRPSGHANPPVSLSPNPTTNRFQSLTGVPGTMMMGPGPMNMSFGGPASANGGLQQSMQSAYMGMWNGTHGGLPMAHQSPMMMSAMMSAMMMGQSSGQQQHPLGAAIPSYNPHLPSPSANQFFQFGCPNTNINSSLPSPPTPASSQHFPNHNSPINSQLPFVLHQPFQNILPHHQTLDHNQAAHQPPAPNNNPNLGHFNPWFYRPP
ncbi:hypothetical protein PtB15_5B772 [Puccinia triticina]|nr:hypothetical protein PtB15_5B772 [Puccinia triticina]